MTFLAALTARLRTARGAGGGTVRASLEGLLVALLTRLITRRAAHLPLCDDVSDDEEEDYVLSSDLPVMGSGPFAAMVEYGLLPDWILRGTPARGMRRAVPAPAPRASAVDVRGPPAGWHPFIGANPPPRGEADSRRSSFRQENYAGAHT